MRFAVKILPIVVAIFTLGTFLSLPLLTGTAAAAAMCPDGGPAPDGDSANCPGSDPSKNNSTPDNSSKHYCGGIGGQRTQTAIDFGCTGKGNALLDLSFAIIRWLSDGVGIVVVASLVVGGVQYSAAGGDPSATQAAIKRMRSSVTALIIFIFAYAILNYVLPGAFLK